jgi:mannosyltransferase
VALLDRFNRVSPQTAVVAVATIAAFWLRLGTITAESLWWDEVVTLQQTRGSFGDLIALTAADNYPPLHNILVQLSLRLFGETEFGLRLPSAILGALTVPLCYWTGAQLGSRTGGMIAAVLLTVAGFHIWYSQEARAYALLAFAATAYAGSVLWVAREQRWPAAIAGVLSGAALLYSHPYGAFTFAAIAAVMFVLLWLRRQEWALGPLRFALLQVVAGLTFVPWALVLLNRARAIEAAGFWIPEITAFRTFYYLLQLLTGPVMIMAVISGCVFLLLRPRSVTQIAFLGVWAFGPLAAGIVLSLLTQPLLVQRYLIGSLPALLLIAGIGFSKLTGHFRTVGFAVLALAAVTTYIGFWPPARTDFRAIAPVLQGKMEADDCLVMWKPAVDGIAHYLGAKPGCLVTTEGGYADIDLAERTPRHIFVILTPDEATENEHIAALGERLSITEFGEARLLEIRP